MLLTHTRGMSPGSRLLLLGLLVSSAAADLSARYDEKTGRILILSNKDGHVVEVGYIIGHSDKSSPSPRHERRSNEEYFYFDSSSVSLRRHDGTDHCLSARHRIKSSTTAVTVCQKHLGAHIYGGLETTYQTWPIESTKYDHYPYVPNAGNHQAVVVRYWLFSDGRFVHIKPNVPLFIDQNTNQSLDAICFIAENKAPYPIDRSEIIMEWDLCSFDDVKQAHVYAVENYLGKPTAIPDAGMATYPIWSTWARFRGSVNDSKVRQLANEVTANKFSKSQIEIDDNWETCYGSFTFDTTAFPDMRGLTNDLHALGFRVTLWVHPFVNSNCEPVYSDALAKGYFVSNTDGSTFTVWWRGSGAIVDFTNREAAAWWSNRLWALLNETGIDSLKFDAGETNLLPQLPVLEPAELNPVVFTDQYASTASQFGPLVEMRASVQSQRLPHFFRMVDLDSNWSGQNGLRTMIPKLLQMNIVGHPFVLPDMVGGNGYHGESPSSDLFIRWLQTNVFMPAVQYSLAPWNFDNETLEICRNMTDLHIQYGPRIVELMEKAVKDGTPVNLPIWWLDPTDETALTIDSEFLLGEDLLVAPVLYHDSVMRDIYVPKGSWRDEADPEHPTIEGPTWLRKYPAPRNTLPYFTRVSSS
ncbi:myogenesis-regulating glycosidase-like [Schistocerca nitens]|uniref:myogenesis-regulating glycosidase-like n=1 Tax=Schistocerca nitens TaxID=7011 RepID=UPI002118F2F8|nr:myogenesis-regulating glycosidase-like [Schistocerca nitens]